MVEIKFIKDTEGGYKKGDIVKATKKEAEAIIKEGYAEYADEELRKKELILKRIKLKKKEKIKDEDLEWMSEINQKFEDNNLTISKKDWDKLRSLEGKERKLFLYKLGEFIEGYDEEVVIWVGHVSIRIHKEKEKKDLNKAGSYISNKRNLANVFYEKQPYFYDKGKLWWIWDFKSYCWERVDETDILNAISKRNYVDTISSKEKTEILESLKQEGRLKIPKSVEHTWIQFQNKIIDIRTGKEFEATPKYFVTNPIPWKCHNDNYMETPTIERIFEEWVGKEHVKILYEIIAYCLLPSYPIHRLFCFIGEGMNGKSCFLRLLKKFIGAKNVTSTELDTLLTSRFEITRLHKKLVCIMGETNFSELSKTSIIKKLTGQDMIGYEYKNKDPFEDINYAKILIATNNLPTTTDKTLGFYRRWTIIDFPNRFSEEKDILNDIPEEEFESLALKCQFLLKDILEKRKFTNEGSIEERAEKYESKSNFLEKFLNEFTKEDLNEYITKSNFYKQFTAWCKENRHRAMSETSLGIKMKELGIEGSTKYFDWLHDGKGGNARIWLGIKWKN